MKFRIGDLVRFVDEPIEGHITSMQPNDIVGVTDDTGFVDSRANGQKSRLFSAICAVQMMSLISMLLH